MGGLPGFAPWETHSLSETHNKLWDGSPDYLYNLTDVQNPNLFATQSCEFDFGPSTSRALTLVLTCCVCPPVLLDTTLIQTGPDEAIVIYNRYCEFDFGPSTSRVLTLACCVCPPVLLDHPTDGSPGCLNDYPCDGLLINNHGLNYPSAVNGSSVPAGQPCLPSSCSGPNQEQCQDTCKKTPQNPDAQDSYE